VSETLTLTQRLQSRVAHWGGMLTGGLLGRTTVGAQGLPVNLGDYELASHGRGQTTSMNGVDQSVVWVVVALLLWGMVMVYSASIAMPDNPRFSRYEHTHFLLRHVISIAIGCVMALLAFQVRMETWEKSARPLFLLSLVL
jgi:cell division protein FtsW